MGSIILTNRTEKLEAENMSNIIGGKYEGNASKAGVKLY